MTEFAETPESIAALRRYFEGHEAAYAAITANRFAEFMAQTNKAAEELRMMARPEWAGK